MRKLRPYRRTIPATLALLSAALLIGFISHDRRRPPPAASTPAHAPASETTGDSPRADSRAVGRSASAGREERERVGRAYGQLPLSFEENAGQFGRGVSFAARGDGYSISLKATGAVFELRGQSRRAEEAAPRAEGVAQSASGATPDDSAGRRAPDRVSMRLAGANPAPRVEGGERLGGVSNYFIGRDPAAWRANVPTFASVEYAGVYPGVDLVYYGNQRQLEYDFRLAPGADPRRIGIEFDGAQDLRLDANGDLVLRTAAGGELRQLKPVSYQLIGGERREVESRYALAGGRRAVFELGDYDARHPLVIDPVISYSTYLGGTGFDEGRAMALGPDGSVYVTGETTSTDFPGASVIQAGRAGGTDAFVLKLNPAGTALVYATYLGGANVDRGTGVALDGDGNAYVAGHTQSANFPTTAGALQTTFGGSIDAFACKINATGTAIVYSTYLGGPSADEARAVAVDSSGRAHVAGNAFSARFVNGAAMQKAGSAVYKTADAAANWQPAENGFDDFSGRAFAVHPADPNTVYAGASIGVYKTTDGGATWSLTGGGGGDINTSPASVNALAVDPFNGSTLYVATQIGIYKSTDGGASYARIINGLQSSTGTSFSIAADPSTPNTLYAGTTNGVFKTTNGGGSWAAVNTGLPTATSQRQTADFAIDPTNTAVVYAATARGVFKTTNGGATWAAANNGIASFIFPTPSISSLVIDPNATATLYAATPFGVYKTTNGAAGWTLINTGLQAQTPSGPFTPSVVALAIDPNATGTLYAGTTASGVFKSTDAGATWGASSAGLSNRNLNPNALEVVRANPSIIYAGFSSGADAFAVRLNAGGTAADYSVFLGSSEDDRASGVAVDAAGNAYVAGTTAAADFPTAAPLQAAFGGEIDGFLAKLSPAGATVYSTYLGGNSLDGASAVAVDSSGRAHVTGFTFSANFPTAGPRQTSLMPDSSDVFVARLSAAGNTLDYSVLHGGQFFEEAEAIAVDAAGNAYVTGFTVSSDFPTSNAPQPTFGGVQDAFVLKLGPASGVVYSTFLGGASIDVGYGIAADSGGAAYVVGGTFSSDFPTLAPLDATAGGQNTSDAFFTKLGTSVDLAVAIADAPDPVAAGGGLAYTINVSNVGELPATGARLTVATPAGAAFVSAGASQGTCSGTGPIVCELGSLAAGATATVAVNVTAPAVRTITATATVAANEAEVVTANNADSEATTVDFADLSLTASALRSTSPAGGRVSYLFGARNAGPSDAANVVVNVTLPPGMTFVSCGGAGAVCGGAGGARTVGFSSLAAGASRSAVLVAEVNAGVADGTELSVSASVSSSLPDPAPADNSASAAVTVSSAAAPPKGNGKLAFTTFSGGGLYVVNEDGTGQTKLRDGNIGPPAWSPDGTRIAFVNEVFNGSFSVFEVRVVNADGTNPRLLSVQGALDSRPTWSPNGAAVAFIGREGNSIRIVNADGPPAEATLASNLPFLDEVDWSPDGSRLLYGTLAGDIWTINVDGTGQTPVNNDPSFVDTQPDWSPDGSKIMFLRRTDPNVSDSETIFEMNADGSNVRRLPNFQGRVRRPVYSPDGQKIAFEREADINGTGFLLPALFTMNADGTNVTQVPANGTGGRAPSWQPLPGATPPPPPPPTFRIAGRVSFPASHAGLAQFTISLTGSRTASVSTDSQGNYSFTVPAGDYTVTPQPNTFFSVSPAGYTFNNLSADQTAADFTATPIIFSVSGRVRLPDGTPIPGIQVTLNGGFPEQRTAVTGADGAYAFSNLAPFSNYVVFVSLSSRTAFDFEPDARAFSPLGQSRVVDFVGTPTRKFEIGSRYITGEGFGRLTVTVTRSGDASVPASVSYRTVDGSAVLTPCAQSGGGAAFARCDYATSVDTLDFAPGETAKTFDIPLIDDAHVESPENFTAVLFNPSANSKLGQTTSAFITIEDNDTDPAAPNPVENSTFFVRMQYLDFLSREPEAGEPWTGVLARCPNVFNTDPQSQSAGCDRLLVSQSFFQSPEFQLKGLYAYLFYRIAFDRRPTYDEITPDMRSLAGATPQEVFAKRAAYATAVTQRGDFAMRYSTATNAQYVDALLGRHSLQQITTEDPANFEGTAQVTLTRQQLIDALNNGTLSRAQVLRAVVQSSEVDAAEFHGAFVAMQYYGYLRRTPEEEGYQAWLRVIKQDPNNIRLMVNGFMNSQEYKLRFGRP